MVSFVICENDKTHTNTSTTFIRTGSILYISLVSQTVEHILGSLSVSTGHQPGTWNSPMMYVKDVSINRQ